jgi:hypothetical protein
MRWVFAILFGILGIVLGICVDALIVMFLHRTLAVYGIDYYLGLPFAMILVIILVLVSGLALGSRFGYMLGRRFKSK